MGPFLWMCQETKLSSFLLGSVCLKLYPCMYAKPDSMPLISTMLGKTHFLHQLNIWLWPWKLGLNNVWLTLTKVQLTNPRITRHNITKKHTSKILFVSKMFLKVIWASLKESATIACLTRTQMTSSGLHLMVDSSSAPNSFILPASGWLTVPGTGVKESEMLEKDLLVLWRIFFLHSGKMPTFLLEISMVLFVSGGVKDWDWFGESTEKFKGLSKTSHKLSLLSEYSPSDC